MTYNCFISDELTAMLDRACLIADDQLLKLQDAISAAALRKAFVHATID